MKILNALGYGGIMMVIGMLVVFFGLALLIVILVFKPTGLFGEKSTDKV